MLYSISFLNFITTTDKAVEITAISRKTAVCSYSRVITPRIGKVTSVMIMIAQPPTNSVQALIVDRV